MLSVVLITASCLLSSGIVSYVNGFKSDAAATVAIGKPFFFGETNSGMFGC